MASTVPFRFGEKNETCFPKLKLRGLSLLQKRKQGKQKIPHNAFDY